MRLETKIASLSTGPCARPMLIYISMTTEMLYLRPRTCTVRPKWTVTNGNELTTHKKFKKLLAFTSWTDRDIQHHLDNLCNWPTERNYYIRGYIQSDRWPVLIMNYIAGNHAGDATDRRALHWNQCLEWPTDQLSTTVRNHRQQPTEHYLQCAVQRPNRTNRALQYTTADRVLQCALQQPTEHYSTQCTHRDPPTDRTTVMKTNSTTATSPWPAL